MSPAGTIFAGDVSLRSALTIWPSLGLGVGRPGPFRGTRTAKRRPSHQSRVYAQFTAQTANASPSLWQRTMKLDCVADEDHFSGSAPLFDLRAVESMDECQCVTRSRQATIEMYSCS